MTTVLEVRNPRDVARLMQEIHVDSYGIKIMVPKAITHLVRVHAIANFAANILKQEMLSLGADAAIARGALTGKVRKTDCLLMGTLAQFRRLEEKLARQPFGLTRLAGELREALDNYRQEDFTLLLGGKKLDTRRRTPIMGIVNLTPDSFSADGMYPRFRMEYILRHIEQMAEDGADIIDIGGESSRPGAEPVPVKKELARTIPVIRALKKRLKVPVSIDTCKPEVARQALENGACMINDITGLCDKRMLRVASSCRAAVVIMHMKGKPRTMQRHPVYKRGVLEETLEFFRQAVERAESSGIKRENIIIDPGIGFGKTFEHNLEILQRLSEYRVLGRPILVGPSRKSFIGRILDVEPKERLCGSIAACLLAVENGARIVRVHDVKELRQALDVFDRIRRYAP